MRVGYAPIGAPAYDGIGPFRALFSSSVSLRSAPNLDDLDAIILWGGADISPSLYDEPRFSNSGPDEPSPRDLFEWSLIREAELKGIPIIGICRGAQLMCAYVGGKLVQDVNNHTGSGHGITTNTGEHFFVTSCHHQMMYPFDVEHELIAWSTKHQATKYNPPDRLYCQEMEKHIYKEPEIVFFPEIKGYGIQCHPEWHTEDDPFNAWIMKDIINKCFKD